MRKITTRQHGRAAFRRFAAIVLAAFGLAGCGGDDAAAGEPAGPAPDTSYEVALSGSVGDGPIAGATLTIASVTGEALATATSGQDADYTVQFTAEGRHYPLVVMASGGTDLVTKLGAEFDLESAVTAPGSDAVANLNPFTTLALAAARDRSGGLTRSNIDAAVATVVAEFNFGLVALAPNGVMTAVIDESNIAEMVKSSEALAELLRRTRDVMLAARGTASIAGVIAALGADLADGTLDGRGGPATDAHVSAAAGLVAAEVLVESMSNRLRVHGQPVTAALDAVIADLGGSASATDALPVTAAQLAQARAGIDAARAIAPSAALDDLRTALDTVAAGMLPSAVRARLPVDAGSELDPAVTRISSGLASDIETVNTITAGGSVPSTDPDPETDPETDPDPTPEPEPEPEPDAPNSAPTISGTPSTQVLVGNAYAFQPNAADADDDVLTFSISNPPSWASFDASTGRLAGTPDAGDVGTYTDIVIRVSDGTATTSLAAFAIAVDAIANGSATLSWQPPTQNTDGTALTNLAGYSVHWGTESGAYTHAVTLDGSGLTSYVVENLTGGTWYFATRAFTSSGIYSGYSNEASKTIE